MVLPQPFPRFGEDEPYNPAIRLFGRRFVKEQTVVEYLSELLSIVFSDKWIFSDELIESPLPSLQVLRKWSNPAGATPPLHYRPKIRLNLKLFSFLGCSPVSKRHDIHRKHYRQLTTKFRESIKSHDRTQEEIRECIEDLLRGFQGAGFGRTWCAQTFYPVSSGLLTQETIWNVTTARENNVGSWEESVADSNFNKYYSTTRRDFLARGGEVLYLQLCNALSIENKHISAFIRDARPFFSDDEVDLSILHSSLQNGFLKLYGSCTEPLNHLVDYIESFDKDTYVHINKDSKRLTCEWCPRDSWPEGYLFAVELNRLLSAKLDPVDKLELVMTGCALQVLRSLCAQSARYAQEATNSVKDAPLGYAWIFSSPSSSSKQQRLASRRNLRVTQGLIQKALRVDALQEYIRDGLKDDQKVKARYVEADNRYGHKMFRSLGTNLGIIIPRRGVARFVMTERVLRYMVMALLRPGERRTYDEFLERLYYHYGIAIERSQLEDATIWSGLPANDYVQSGENESWLSQMLRAAGFLTELSDACSIVHNPFGNIMN